MLPVEGFGDQRNNSRAPSAEQDRIDRHAFRILPLGRDHRALRRGAAVNRAFGCAAFRPESGVQGRRSQSTNLAGFSSVIPSHHTSPSIVIAQFVKMEFLVTLSMALAFDFMLVPGATPKKPYSGLMA